VSSALPACRRFLLVFLWSAFSQWPTCYRELTRALAMLQYPFGRTRLAKRTLLGVIRVAYRTHLHEYW